MPEIHPLADVKSINIGPGTRIWQFVVVLPQAVIGENCNICAQSFIENHVFIGPNVTFTNDKYPRSKVFPARFQTIQIRTGASIGAGSVVLGGVEIGQNAMVGAGSLVTESIPPNELWFGSPAKFIRKLDSKFD
jgi:acetyltransferase-like isoleucine patch superfamily enzyme